MKYLQFLAEMIENRPALEARVATRFNTIEGAEAVKMVGSGKSMN